MWGGGGGGGGETRKFKKPGKKVSCKDIPSSIDDGECAVTQQRLWRWCEGVKNSGQNLPKGSVNLYENDSINELQIIMGC